MSVDALFTPKRNVAASRLLRDDAIDERRFRELQGSGPGPDQTVDRGCQVGWCHPASGSVSENHPGGSRERDCGYIGRIFLTVNVIFSPF